MSTSVSSARWSGRPVVVGVDGSAASLFAVDLAVAEAAERHRPLRVVHAFLWPLLHVPLGPAPGAPAGAGLRAQAERLVAEAVGRASDAHPDVPVSGEVVVGTIAPVLLRESAHAEVLVLGDRGLGGFTGLLVGSIAIQVVAHATCPVLVARDDRRPDDAAHTPPDHAVSPGEPPPRGRPIVVGVDGSSHCLHAVDYALAVADRRGASVLAILAWKHPAATAAARLGLPGLDDVYDVEKGTQEGYRVLAEALAGQAERHPDVPIEQLVTHRRPAPALLERSAQAALVVVGARGRGGFTGLLLGSVSQALLHHARCPVAIVRRTPRPG